MKPVKTITISSALISSLLLLAGFVLALPVFSLSAWAAYRPTAKLLVHSGDTVILHQDINSDLGARIHIQYGKAKPFSDLYELDPYCYFYFHRGSDELKKPLQLTTGRYPITRVSHRRMSMHRTRLQYAFIGLGNGGGSQYTMATQFDLHSAANPELNSLICGVWADPSERRNLSLKEISDTLGDLVTIETVGD